jgi:hypothetical protein
MMALIKDWIEVKSVYRNCIILIGKYGINSAIYRSNHIKFNLTRGSHYQIPSLRQRPKEMEK